MSLTGIKIGVLTLVSFDDIFSQFAPYGFKRKGFLLFLNAIGVPFMEMPDGTRLIDISSFQLGVKAALRYGAPNFICPNAPAHRTNSTSGLKNSRASLTAADYLDNWKELLGEIKFSAEVNIESLPPDTKEVFEAARDRIAMGFAHLTATSVSSVRSTFKKNATETIQHAR